MTEDRQLSCQELVELVTDYLEGALSPEDTARFEDHIVWCPGCAAYLEQIRKTIELTGRLTAECSRPTPSDAARSLPGLALALTSSPGRQVTAARVRILHPCLAGARTCSSHSLCSWRSD